jgi:hypothetical protein
LWEDDVAGETTRGNEGPAHGEAEVIVLAAGLRTGVRIVPLTRSLARRPAVVGAEVAVTASLADRLPLARSVVVVVPPEMPASSCVLPPVALPGAAVTVTVTRPTPAPHGPGGTLSMYNQHAEALPEAFVEAVAAARRCGLVTPVGNVVLLLQEFVPTTVSAVVRATEDAVRIEGRWGLAEQRSAADTFEVPANGPVSETLARKPTASLAAAGGTHTVAMPDEWQRRSSLGPDVIHRLATLSRDAALTAGMPLSLDIVLGNREPLVLRCRPST